MTDQTAPPSEERPDQTPPLLINLQYIKDLSFEVPHGASVFASLRSAPQVNISIDVQANQIEKEQSIFEVVLAIKAEATEPQQENSNNVKPRTVFIAELAYAGIVTLNGELPPENLESILLIDVPRFLFPFARAIIADTTREGGFPPIVLQPIDFMALWEAKRSQNFPEPAGEA